MGVKRILIAMFILSGFSLCPGLARNAMDRPNVVIFFLDDAGYGDFSHNGNPTIRTPNISKLASDGALFTQFYTTSPACSASRYSLLTGRYPGRSGLGSWVIGPGSKRYLHPKEVTLAEGFKSQGYTTGMFGKWHLGNPNTANGMAPKSLPLSHGFDQWVGTNVSHDYDNAKLLESVPGGDDPIPGYSTLATNLPSDQAASESLTGRYAESAVRFIQANSDRPFFAYIAHNMPHLGIYASDPFKGRSRRGLLGDVMEEIDDSVGRVLAAINEEGISKNTLIIFSSDNGPWLMFKNTEAHKKYGEARMHVGNAYPFRDGKGSTWEGGHRVPGIFYWPGVIEPVTVEQSPISTLDILPTLFELIGADIPTDRTIDGRDIRSYLAPMHFNGKVNPFNFIYSYYDNKGSAIRQGPWKMHWRIGSQLKNNYGFKASRETPLLFQVEQDLGERIDRASEHPELVRAMLGALDDLETQIAQEGSFWGRQ